MMFVLLRSATAESDDNDDVDAADTKDGIKKEGGCKSEAYSLKDGAVGGTPKAEMGAKDAQQRSKELKIAETEIVRDLKIQLK